MTYKVMPDDALKVILLQTDLLMAPPTNFADPLVTGTAAGSIKVGTKSSVLLTSISIPLKHLLVWQSISTNVLAAPDNFAISIHPLP